MSIILTDENFEKEVLEAEKPVLVDFWMDGCRPCFLFFPIFEKLENEFSEKIIFAKINLNQAFSIAENHGVSAAPTVMLFCKGKEINRFIGFKEEKETRTWLEENLLIQEYQDHAEKNGFFLNPNKKAVETIIRKLLEREKEFGQRYCPCRRISKDTEEDKKIICPCTYHIEEIEKDGHCICQFFVKNV